MPRPCCWRLPVLAGQPLRLAATHRSWQRNWAATCRSSCWAARRSALGRGTELYPLPDRRARAGVVVAPELHVSTADAYRRLSAAIDIGITTK